MLEGSQEAAGARATRAVPAPDAISTLRREEALNDEARIMERLRTMGPCPAGFAWFRSGNGWRCGGGSHFVYDDDPILNMD